MSPEPKPDLPAPLAQSRALREFLAAEVVGGAVLVAAAVAAVVWANSPRQHAYHQLWSTELAMTLGRWHLQLNLQQWVDEGLMAVFFLVVGLEVKRELLHGELRDRRRAALPVVAAAGGMLVPAMLYAAINAGGAGSGGWGIPMATDIAFAVGVLALVAPGIPAAGRVFLLTLAIVDDIGAIVVIAVFYSDALALPWLAAAVGCVLGVIVLRQCRLRFTPIYVTLGVAMWLALHAAGIHATIAGVVMGLLAPAEPMLDAEVIATQHAELTDVSTPTAAQTTTRLARHAVSELEWLEQALHPWTSLLIVPLFALANAGVTLTAASLQGSVTSGVTVGVLVALVAGKTIGIAGASWLAIHAGVAELPAELRWRHVLGLAALGGIGFTVSLFIAHLAFSDPVQAVDATIGIFAASIAATIVAAVLLRSRDLRSAPSP